MVLDGVSKHGEVGGDLVEKLEHGLLWQLVQVSRLEAAGTLWTPVLPGQLQGSPLVFTHSQTGGARVNLMSLKVTPPVEQVRPLLGQVLVLYHISERQLADPGEKFGNFENCSRLFVIACILG